MESETLWDFHCLSGMRMMDATNAIARVATFHNHLLPFLVGLQYRMQRRSHVVCLFVFWAAFCISKFAGFLAVWVSRDVASRQLERQIWKTQNLFLIIQQDCIPYLKETSWIETKSLKLFLATIIVHPDLTTAPETFLCFVFVTLQILSWMWATEWTSHTFHPFIILPAAGGGSVFARS